MSARYTLDGSSALEDQLARLCDAAQDGVQAVVPPDRLDAVVLGGGYGRGQGGVLKTGSGDAPYNDLEFYVFARGNRLWSQRAYCAALRALGERLSTETLHVEFKVDSLERFRRSPVSMFSYDLVSGHRVIMHRPASQKNGPGDSPLQFAADAPNGNPAAAGRSAAVETEPWLFGGCEHHLNAGAIPLREATRLLFNRCTGLLLAKELLRKKDLAPEECDFTGRNLAKAQLALGDVVLAGAGQYHWSCLERHERLDRLRLPDAPAGLPRLLEHHAAGVAFKLHPRRIRKSTREFAEEHQELSGLALQVWLWLESRRLNQSFSSARDYAFSPVSKCPEASRLRSFLLNLDTFGSRAAFQHRSLRYPRERLLNSLALLLWEENATKDLKVRRHLQNELLTTASDWPGLVAAYKAVWPKFG